jgi:hypothetical protein
MKHTEILSPIKYTSYVITTREAAVPIFSAIVRQIVSNSRCLPRAIILRCEERISNSVSTAIQLWKPINLRNPEDGDDTFSETSVQTSATRYNIPEDIFN